MSFYSQVRLVRNLLFFPDRAFSDFDLSVMIPSPAFTGIAFSSESTSDMVDIVISSFVAFSNSLAMSGKRIRAHVFVCVLSLLVSKLIEKAQGMSIERTAEILTGIRAIPVRSPMNMVYCSGFVETTDLLNKLKIKPPDQIPIGALP